MVKGLTWISLIMLIFSVRSAHAVETHIDVRIRTKDAKFLGTSMGGAQVTIRNTETGELLAKGVTSGTTGNTEIIMRTPHARGGLLADGQSARFRAVVDIAEPTRVEVRAAGPLSQRQGMGEVSVTQWLIPGKHVTGGDGLVLELPGFVVDVLDPPAHRTVSLEGNTVTVLVRASVTMMCGCPVAPGGLWNADGYEIRALIKRDGGLPQEVPLRFAGESSQFSGEIVVRQPGVYEVTVYAFDPANGNTGLDRTTFIAQ
jgi:hypothetical protein